jgi:hypothetical protein
MIAKFDASEKTHPRGRIQAGEIISELRRGVLRAFKFAFPLSRASIFTRVVHMPGEFELDRTLVVCCRGAEQMFRKRGIIGDLVVRASQG